MRQLLVGLLLVAAGAAGCAKQQPPPPKPTGPDWDTSPPGAFKEEEERRKREADDGLKVAGTIGTLDESDVQNTIKSQWDELNLCYQNGLRSLPELGGQMKLKFRVGRDGKVKLATVTESNLGVFSVERCVIDIARRLTFPKPQGGEAEVTYPLSFPPRGRPVKEYSEELVQSDLRRSRRDLDECKKQVTRGRPPRRFRVTLYLAPGGYKRGKAIGKAKFVGYASTEEGMHDDFALCVVERIRSWTFAPPPGPLAKISFEWPLSR